MTAKGRPGVTGAPPPEQVHLQFGPDAACEVVASWVTREPVRRPHLRLGTAADGHGRTIDAIERSMTEALTGERVWTYHAIIDGLEPDTPYIYEVGHRGTDFVAGWFRTGPDGRSTGFRFTSFGDLSVPYAGGRGRGPASHNARYTVDAVEAANPLFHLVNGDLSYANVSDDPVGTWTAFATNVSRSARYRPWMPCAGNHENEVANGPQGLLAYQTRFFVPDNGAAPDFIGNWYAFTAGAVRFISINADDVCLQDGSFSTPRYRHLPSGCRRDPYILGYSGGAQRRWLEAALASARQDPAIDWIVVCMHQVAMSSVPFNGADLGIRRELLPLFDAYGVDLVLSGHEHYYQRTHAVRGTVPGSDLLTPQVAGRIDAEESTSTMLGTVHLTIGVGGNPTYPSASSFGDRLEGRVICDVGKAEPGRPRPSIKQSEPADWLAFRTAGHPFGFTVLDVDPGMPGGLTRIRGVHYGALAGSAVYEPVDRFTLERPRADAMRAPGGAPVKVAGAAAPAPPR